MFATKPENIRAAINKEEIAATALTFYKTTHSALIICWNTACAGDNLGTYISPPSTWISRKGEENPAKKQKNLDSSAPSGRSGASATPSNTRTNTTNRTTGSNPNLGMLNAPAHIRNGPQLSNGQKVCMPFIRLGESCSLGRSCPNAHATPRFTTLPDLIRQPHHH
jgi:hypothetical protein